MAEFRKVLPEVVNGPAALKKYEIASAEPL